MSLRTLLQRLVALCLCLQVALKAVRGHGYMCSPAARNAVVLCGWPSYFPRDYNENALNAGGPQQVYGSGQSYPDGKHGLCGDPWDQSPQAHMKGGWLYTDFKTATYRPGQKVKVEVITVYHHKGFFEWFICKLDGSGKDEVTQDCLDKGGRVPLADGNHRWWMPYAEPGSTQPYYIELQLPEDLTCEHCVLQWHYHTANSCNPPGIPAGARALTNSNMGGCQRPEEFWNCADIRITSDPSASITQGPSHGLTTPADTDNPPDMGTSQSQKSLGGQNAPNPSGGQNAPSPSGSPNGSPSSGGHNGSPQSGGQNGSPPSGGQNDCPPPSDGQNEPPPPPPSGGQNGSNSSGDKSRPKGGRRLRGLSETR